jgi:DNA-binding MarR family transcriptional regulator
VTARARAFPIDIRALPLTHLAFFVGTFANRQLTADMKRAGYGDLREPHGYLFQHLLDEPRSVGELSRRLGVTQQAVSKTVSELTRAGYLETTPGDDARVRLVRLSERGHAAVRAARRLRAKLEQRLLTRLGKKRATAVRLALGDLLEELEGADAVRARRVPPSDAKPGTDA